MKTITPNRLIPVLLSGLLAACAVQPTAAPQASAELMARSGSQVSGQVTFHETAGGLRVEARISGLTPGEHGFHVHEAGDCSAPDALSAKGHFNPLGKAHGHHGAGEHHVGDMPNLIADASGRATYSHTLAGLRLQGETGVVGRAVIVHADPDDYRSQPAGNAGKRVACGVIKGG